MTQTKAELINGKGDVTFDTNTLFIDAVNNRVGIGTTSPGIVLEVFKGTFPDFQLKDTAGRIHRLAINSDAADPKAAFISDSPWVWQTSGGAERARIDSSGRLLVGTSTARSNFYNSTISAGVQIEGTTGDAASLAIIADRSGAPPKLILAASGGSTIGSNAVVASGNGAGSISFQASDGTEFVQLAEINADVDGTPGANDMPGRLVFSTTADGASSLTERMRIRSSTATEISIIGAPSIATNTGSIDFRTSGQARAWNIATDTINFYIADADFSNYAYLAQNPTSWQFASDARLKENIADLDYGIEAIKQIKAKRFNFIGDSVSTIGFVAQELKEVIPEAVSGEEIPYGEDDTPQEKAQKSLGIGKETLIPVLVNALQEAIAKIESLEARLTAAGI